ncbi:hypothetical protein ZIOFF_054410 [Zingiber officinale]|uniref:Protein NEGATIVE REGULATOR OF RESISTANCE n=1 Tax=Zingiber officinale TaxID=94328 RepID=A0A8J5FFW7_ZINOF|nr:hypothetical protein ZIOFF_054410 [Zingiber officinale]
MEIAAAERRRRKREPGDAVGAVRPAARRRSATTEDVTDDEVEEFFAILSRMREATRLLAPSAAAGREAAKAESAPRWRPAFEREDFEEAGAAESASRRRDRRSVASEGWERSRKAAAEREDDCDEEERVAENGTAGRSLDLNEEPAGDE